MKIIRSGWAAEDGIHFVCEICECEYLVESNKEWITRKLKDWDGVDYTSYITSCPECGHKEEIGVDPNIFEGGGKLITRYEPIFNRPDWDERFKVKLEGSI